MRLTLVGLFLVPGAAWADPGHIGTVVDHNHLLAGVAIGTAVAVALWDWVKSAKKARDDHGAQDAPESAPGEEAEA